MSYLCRVKCYCLIIATCGAAYGVTLLSLVTPLLAEQPAAEQQAVEQQASEQRQEHAKPSQEAPDLGREWVRLLKDDQGEATAMQTAIVRYTPAENGDGMPKGVYVDLVGAVHVGDRAYYDRLNRLFTEYEALLYELVAPEGTVVERGRGTSSAHPVGALQNGLKQMLDLEHQLEQIDYTRPNFVHADMSPDQMSKTMESRGESFLQMYFRLVGQAIAQQSRSTAEGQSLDFDLFSALFASDRARQLKVILAGQLAEVESLLVGFGGEQGSTLIEERNKVALDVLRREMAAGKKKLAVFYGAGHLADMDSRLREMFGLVPTEIVWVTAWDLAKQ
jgi:hypothetical protein